jgi:hypothetical protein
MYRTILRDLCEVHTIFIMKTNRKTQILCDFNIEIIEFEFMNNPGLKLYWSF